MTGLFHLPGLGFKYPGIFAYLVIVMRLAADSKADHAQRHRAQRPTLKKHLDAGPRELGDAETDAQDPAGVSTMERVKIPFN